MNNQGLKPCPFCGNEAVSIQSEPDHPEYGSGGRFYYVRCPACRAQSGSKYARVYIRNTHGGSKEAVEWVNDLNQAQVFPHEHMIKRRIPELENAIAVKAKATIVVTIGEWEV